MKRRTYLTAASGAAVTALAGCSAIIEGLLDFTLEDLNVMSNADEPVGIGFEVVDPEGETLIEQTAFLDGVDDESDDDDMPTQQFADLWETTGEHTVTADVDERLSNTETIAIEETDDSVGIVYEDGELKIGLFEDVFDD